MFGLLNGRMRGLLDGGLQDWTPSWQRNQQLRAVNAPMQPTTYQMPALASAWQQIGQAASQQRGTEQQQMMAQTNAPQASPWWQPAVTPYQVTPLPQWQAPELMPAWNVMDNVVTQSQPKPYDWNAWRNGSQ